MPEFVWRAAQPDAKIVEGRLHAPTQAQAMQQLRTQGLTPLLLKEAGSLGASGKQPAPLALIAPPSARWFKSGTITAADVLVMTSELSIMLKAGLSLDSALRVLIGMSAKPDLVKLTQTLLEDVKGGAPLSRALARHPQQFGDFYINMVRSGEVSGQLSVVLERLVEHLERLRALRESVISAAIYPAILLVVALLSLVAMLGFVVPQFETLFTGMGDALPLPTKIIMTIGQAFTNYGLAMALGAAVLAWLLRLWWRSPSGIRWWQSRALTLPLVGKLILKYNLTLFVRSLGTLLGNGVPLITAIQIATQTVDNLKLRLALEGVIPKVKGGSKMVDAIAASGIFEPLAINLLKVGEETGRMGTMLLEVARIFNTDVEIGIKRCLTMLEPVLILVLGLLVGAIIVSIMLGILSVNDLAV
jgi:general secretion pathway protein F